MARLTDRGCAMQAPSETRSPAAARLGIAAGLTVDETRTVFAAWKPFFPSAVSSSIRYSEETATTLALAPSAPPAVPAGTAIKETGGD
jgi:hypothetical protein